MEYLLPIATIIITMTTITTTVIYYYLILSYTIIYIYISYSSTKFKCSVNCKDSSLEIIIISSYSYDLSSLSPLPTFGFRGPQSA